MKVPWHLSLVHIGPVELCTGSLLGEVSLSALFAPEVKMVQFFEPNLLVFLRRVFVELVTAI